MLQRLRHGHRGSGIQWPCTAEAPDGTERLCVDGRFWSDPEVCEEYGHDLLTGAANTATDYRALDPRGRAILKAAHYQPPHEEPDEEFPLLLTTGRTVNHFHTRTRTGRAPELAGAAPTCGWSCPSPTPPRSGWPTATWCGSSPPGATWTRAPASPPSARGGVRPLPLRLLGPAGRRPPRRRARAPTSWPSPSGTRSPSSRSTRSPPCGSPSWTGRVTVRPGMAIEELHRAETARDKELLGTVTECMEQTSVQVKWLKTRIKEAPPQTLTVG